MCFVCFHARFFDDIICICDDLNPSLSLYEAFQNNYYNMYYRIYGSDTWYMLAYKKVNLANKTSFAN